MKKKQLIELIKTESKKVEIKDVQAEILARVQGLPPVEVIQKPRFSWQIKPIYLGLIGAMVFILMFAIFYEPSEPIIPVTPSLEIYDEAIALSTVSSTSLIGLLEYELSSSPSNILLSTFQSFNLDPLVTQEINDLGKYMEMMEKLLSSQNQLNILKEPINEQGFNRRMQFKTTDLLNHEVVYQMKYNQVINMIDDEFTLTGEIELGSKTYQMVAIGNIQNQNRLVYRIYKDAINYVGVTFIKTEQATRYTIRITQDGILTETVEMTALEVNNRHAIQIKFVSGLSIGTYQFLIDTENSEQVIRVNYQIQGSQPETGTMIVRVHSDEETGYQFYVQPTGRPAFTLEKGRQMSENRGRPNLPNN